MGLLDERYGLVDSRLKHAGMTIERKTRSIQQFSKTANCNLDDLMKSVFGTVVCINGKLQDECLERRDLGNLTFLVIPRNRGIPADLSRHWSHGGLLARLATNNWGQAIDSR